MRCLVIKWAHIHIYTHSFNLTNVGMVLVCLSAISAFLRISACLQEDNAVYVKCTYGQSKPLFDYLTYLSRAPTCRKNITGRALS